MRTLSEREFSRRLAVLYPSLVAAALHACGQDGDDVLSTALYKAARAYPSFDEVDAETGPGRFVNWMHRILHNAITDHFREVARRRKNEVELEESGGSSESDYALDNYERANLGWESRWAVLASEKERQEIADAELVAIIRTRIRYADLTEEERVSLLARINGVRLRVVALELGLSKPTVCRRIQSAVLKIRGVEIGLFAEAMAAPELDRYQWRLGTVVTIYHAPPTTGSQLARERLALLR